MSASKLVNSVVGVESTRAIALIFCAGLVLAGCGGGDSEGSASADASSADARTASALGVGNQAVATWTKIADEGASYQVLNGVPVRYGAGAKWVKLRASGTFVCAASAFGSDPAPGVAKTCEAKNVASVGNAKLSWTPSGDTAVTGYRVYYGNSSGNYLQVPGSGMQAGASSSFSIVGLGANQKFYFAVTAADGAGSESTFSNEVSATIAD